MPRYAALDIGSNSIRMLAAEVTPGIAGAPRQLAAEREVTRLGESVFRSGRISRSAIDLACEALARMAEIYRKLDVVGVRAVATSAVRDAANQAEFLKRTAAAAGAPVEIISGQEEARLIHLGVMSCWPQAHQRVLIVDVGGGSAEIIHSEAGAIVEAFSRPLGAVRLQEVFLKSDPPEEIELRRMDEYIAEKLAIATRRIGVRKWDRGIATSASAAAVVSAVNRVPRSRRERTDRLRAGVAQVRRLYKTLATRDVAARRRFPGIGPRRAEIIVPGAAVLLKVMEEFRLPSVNYCAAGVRDGIIADLAARGVGRERSQLSSDQRRAIAELARRYGVAARHARHVAGFSHHLFESLQPIHALPPAYGKLLEAACYLRDVGHFVSDTGHHRHSHYLVAHSDLPGFTDLERSLIALLCRYHRKTLPGPHHADYQALEPEARRAVLFLAPLLRLADGLDRQREQRVESLACQVRNGEIVVEFTARGDVGLEQWAAERTSETFREVYNRPLSVVRIRR